MSFRTGECCADCGTPLDPDSGDCVSCLVDGLRAKLAAAEAEAIHWRNEYAAERGRAHSCEHGLRTRLSQVEAAARALVELSKDMRDLGDSFDEWAEYKLAEERLEALLASAAPNTSEDRPPAREEHD